MKRYFLLYKGGYYESDYDVTIKGNENLKIGERIGTRNIAENDVVTIKYEKGNMPYDEVYDAVYQLLIHENELAGKIMMRMGTSEWQREKEKQLQRKNNKSPINYFKLKNGMLK